MLARESVLHFCMAANECNDFAVLSYIFDAYVTSSVNLKN